MSLAADAEFCPHCGAKVGEHHKVPWWHLHRRLYDWTLTWAYRPTAQVALFCLAFAESSFFPVPPDVLLMPLVLGNRKRWFRYASLCSAASVMGAVAGFLIGWLLWAQVGGFFHDHVPGFGRDQIVLADGNVVQCLVDRNCVQVEGFWSVEASYPLAVDGGRRTFRRQEVKQAKISPFTRVGKLYEKYNFWIVFTAGFTPIPFKVITITAGVFGTGPEVSRPLVFFAVFLLAGVVSRSARFFLVAGMMRIHGPRITPFIDRYFNWLALLFVVLLIGGFLVIQWVS